jgi:hypothetical protein
VVLFSLLAGAGWLLTRQVIDFADKLPYYETNIESKHRPDIQYSGSKKLIRKEPPR